MAFPEPTSGFEEEGNEAVPYHPSAPASELFDDSTTTIDPSYIISLIRKLLLHVPHDVRDNRPDDGAGARCNGFVEDSEMVNGQESTPAGPNSNVQTCTDNESEPMDIPNDENEKSCENKGGEMDGSECHEILTEEEAWEEYGCVLWDLAANKTHAVFMVENLLLDVLLASLAISQSVRVIEINLGILANLACHEAPRSSIISTNGLIYVIVDKLFVDDSTCLSEVCRFLTLALRHSGSVTWAEALRNERVLLRILWVAENTLNSQLLEKSVGLLLAMVDNQHGITVFLLPPLMELGLPNRLINLLEFEVKSLYSDRTPDRFPALDVILEVIEVLSVVEYSTPLAQNRELLKLIVDVVKLPDKSEVSNSCITAIVLFANFLADKPDLISEVLQDVPFLQGLLDTLPYVSDDSEARHALWSVVGKLLLEVHEHVIPPSLLLQYVSVFIEKSDCIEEDLIDHREEDLGEEYKKSEGFYIRRNARVSSLNKIAMILQYWSSVSHSVPEADAPKNDHPDGVLKHLIECCRSNLVFSRPFAIADFLNESGDRIDEQQGNFLDLGLRLQFRTESMIVLLRIEDYCNSNMYILNGSASLLIFSTSIVNSEEMREIKQKLERSYLCNVGSFSMYYT
ncbi:hypothetical protein C5167_033771 [Papaver somniferum]|uniref:Protein saal1 n=1 Tax=Papaver somniferum TaxID=3469 RepID=A0A4Y7KF69_PAPSO|nr:hypothetical protein C5167_033771 [Papaver somniferum]